MARLDTLNTPLTILSTSTPVGGLPLVTILTSDEITATFTKALEMIKKMGPLMAFIMTDDCRVEK
ncbi:8113_t:CDS:2 [Cetraspora pellucida]|uniref:8113_t:CDS:1 n=1 Tax=Cetraspora pellucida TaxID=1433469 RepID=A0A9N8VGC3_9GLOM|nr:8113_t:CDS:2 [Cetraspora pellucida]